MPPLEEFEGGKRHFPVVFSFDATGFRYSQLTTVAVRNPYKRATAAQFRILGIGSLTDSREGALKVISETNLEQIRAAIRHDQADTTMPVKLQNGTAAIAHTVQNLPPQCASLLEPFSVSVDAPLGEASLYLGILWVSTQTQLFLITPQKKFFFLAGEWPKLFRENNV